MGPPCGSSGPVWALGERPCAAVFRNACRTPRHARRVLACAVRPATHRACRVRARYMLQYYSSDLWGQESIVFGRFRLIYPICTGRKRSVTRVMSFRVRRIAAHGAVREYLARNSRRAFTQAPLSRVPARDFFEPDTVVPHGARDMQVPVHDRGGAVPDMPISGALGTAPL